MKQSAHKTKKVILLILDGWGLGPSDDSNPIHIAKTPFIDSLYDKYPWVPICASGGCVGLPPDQVGNSEAGHQNIGAGRTVAQDVVEISQAINTGAFFKNPAFLAALKHAKNKNSSIHLMGLLSNGQSPHSDPDHLLALLTFLRMKKFKRVYIHLFTDGRDSPPRSSLKSVEALERFLTSEEVIATIMGRFYGMDRKKTWERTNKAYEAMTIGVGEKADSPQEAITRAYNANVTDEFIKPTVLFREGKMTPRINEEDAVIFFNLRSDRARQMSKPFVQDEFEKMNPGATARKKVMKQLFFVALTDFGPDLDSILTAYPAIDLRDTLPMLLADTKQVYIAESEKYAHVTYFFNGGYADKVNGEDRVNIPSPKVDSYAKTPAMSTVKITKKVIESIKKYDFICANIACPDMTGHTGDFKAAVMACEAVDMNVKKIAQSALKSNATLIVTADHGNVEYMLNLKTKEIITEHTKNPVPFIIVDKTMPHTMSLKKNGDLGSIAPTILKLFGKSKTKLMKKNSLI